MSSREIFSVGHSTHEMEVFLGILTEHSIELLVDVRRFPGSRRHPQFNKEALEKALRGVGIAYQHMPELGGRRNPAPDSPNFGWEVEAFRGYADHMQSGEFRDALKLLQKHASRRRTSLMCAEAPWWKCHRRILSDALVVWGWKVRHIMPGADATAHRLTEFAVSEGESLTYPPLQFGLDLSELPSVGRQPGR